MLRRRLFSAGLMLICLLAIAAFFFLRWVGGPSPSNDYIRRWLLDPSSRAALETPGGQACPGAPFIIPSDGLIGLLWADPAAPYTLFNRHSGIDIFGAGAPGTVPIYAAYDGYLTRLEDWRSTVIIRHDDPLQPGRRIWTYYTHMANRAGDRSFVAEAFPPGTSEVFVEQGTVLGYQGEFAGSGAAVAMHLHFSIVLSDEEGRFLNESQLGNTLDPTAYLGLPLDIAAAAERPIRCRDAN